MKITRSALLSYIVNRADAIEAEHQFYPYGISWDHQQRPHNAERALAFGEREALMQLMEKFEL